MQRLRKMELLLLVEFLPEDVFAKFLELEAKGRKGAIGIQRIVPVISVAKLDVETHLTVF
jgi:hypothetical protein